MGRRQGSNSLAQRMRIGGAGAALVALAVGGGVLAFLGMAPRLDALATSDGQTGSGRPLATQVEIATVAYQPDVLITRRFLGQVEARQQAELSFEVDGKVARLLVDEGRTVAAGDALAELNTDLARTARDGQAAVLEKVRAQLASTQAQLDRAQNLSARRLADTTLVDETLAQRDGIAARVEELASALQSAEIQLEKAVLYAPFGGIVGDRLVDTGVTVSAGQPVLTLYETDAPMFRVGLPPVVLPEDLSEAVVELGEDLHPVRLVALRPDLDPVTRTRTAVYEFVREGGRGGPAPGSYGLVGALRADLPLRLAGFWLPVEALRSSIEGGWVVMAIDADDIARPAAVEVLHRAGARVYLTGALDEGARVVVSGAHKIAPGERVAVE